LRRPPSLSHRLFAALATVLVLALGIIGADGNLHAKLHAAEHACTHAPGDHHPAPAGPAAHDETCAVELFAAGVSLPVDPTHVVVAPLARDRALAVVTDLRGAAEAPHRLPPGCGPPRA